MYKCIALEWNGKFSKIPISNYTELRINKIIYGKLRRIKRTDYITNVATRADKHCHWQRKYTNRSKIEPVPKFDPTSYSIRGSSIPVEFFPANDRRCLSAVKARIAQTRQVSANKGLPERVGSTTPRYVNLVSPRSRHLNLFHSLSLFLSLPLSPSLFIPFPLFRSLNRLQPSQSTPESGSFAGRGGF